MQIGQKVHSITAGLSGAGILTTDGSAYIIGRFGKIVINVPKKIERERIGMSMSGTSK